MAGRPLNETELEAYDLLPRDLARRVRIHRIRALPGGYAGMTLGNHIVLARPIDEDGTSALLAHELVHVRQWADQGRLGFSSRYLSSFGRNLSRHRRWSRAYSDIDAEREARQETTEWLRRRARRAVEDAQAKRQSVDGEADDDPATDDGDHQG